MLDMFVAGYKTHVLSMPAWLKKQPQIQKFREKMCSGEFFAPKSTLSMLTAHCDGISMMTQSESLPPARKWEKPNQNQSASSFWI
jgi:hypothetical protein